MNTDILLPIKNKLGILYKKKDAQIHFDGLIICKGVYDKIIGIYSDTNTCILEIKDDIHIDKNILVSKDSKYLYIYSKKHINKYSLQDGKEIYSYRLPGNIELCCLTEDGNNLLFADSEKKTYELSFNEESKNIVPKYKITLNYEKPQKIHIIGENKYSYHIHIATSKSPVEHKLVKYYKNRSTEELKFYDTDMRVNRYIFDPCYKYIFYIAYTEDPSDWMASNKYDLYMYTMQKDNERRGKHYKELLKDIKLLNIAISPDSKYLYTGSTEKGKLLQWDLIDLTVCHTYDIPSDVIDIKTDIGYLYLITQEGKIIKIDVMQKKIIKKKKYINKCDFYPLSGDMWISYKLQ
jgi:WD40 repeat protein